MTDSEHRKQLLLQKIEANRELLARDVEAVTGALRPWRKLVGLGRDAAPHLRNLGTAVGGLLASRAGGLRKLGWALPVALPLVVWLMARPER